LGGRRDQGVRARLHLAHPLGIAGYENRRVKNDLRDATLLADLLRMGRLPKAWVAPPEIRELREAVRYRAKLSRLRAGLKTQVHQTLGKEGVIPEVNGIWGPAGRRWLDGVRLGDAYCDRIDSLRELIELYDRQIEQCDTRINWRLHGDRRFEALLRIAGWARCSPRSSSPRSATSPGSPPRQLCSWAGLTPRHRESDTHLHRDDGRSRSTRGVAGRAYRDGGGHGGDRRVPEAGVLRVGGPL
jgi:transposase